ncbi:Uncharacterised protein [Mycobacterium xenopi]|uniref:Uncharacterized protein n=1 Tax=Mycobacterium xenopi TaxID=1789 RepID=A0AAD1H172_MYCXE|nr:hypothetical protein MYXE_30290 [Mycobacterium xenopi]SPX88887.1 Uncharacterised protein [Mycobacterium xenopi]
MAGATRKKQAHVSFSARVRVSHSRCSSDPNNSRCLHGTLVGSVLAGVTAHLLELLASLHPHDQVDLGGLTADEGGRVLAVEGICDSGGQRPAQHWQANLGSAPSAAAAASRWSGCPVPSHRFRETIWRAGSTSVRLHGSAVAGRIIRSGHRRRLRLPPAGGGMISSKQAGPHYNPRKPLILIPRIEAPAEAAHHSVGDHVHPCCSEAFRVSTWG